MRLKSIYTFYISRKKRTKNIDDNEKKGRYFHGISKCSNKLSQGKPLRACKFVINLSDPVCMVRSE